MSRIAYVNGHYLPQSVAAVNVEDRGYQFADGIYEVIYLHGGKLVDADLHFDRLDRSLRELRIAEPMTRTALRCVLNEVARRNRVREGIIYIQVTRGVARRDHAFPARPIPPSVVVTSRRTPRFPRDPEEWAASAITLPDRRWMRCDIKTVGLTANVLAKQTAREQGAVEAILVDREGMVTEGASTTVWIVDAVGHAAHPPSRSCGTARLYPSIIGGAFAGSGYFFRGTGRQRRGTRHRARDVPNQCNELCPSDCAA